MDYSINEDMIMCDMKKIEEKITIMQAYVDGKKIETKFVGGTNWEEVTSPAWDWVSFDYRIKQAVPRAWEEFCEQYEEVDDEYYISAIGKVCTESTNKRDAKSDATCLKTKEDAEGLLAQIKLKRLRDAWWGDWKPDYVDFEGAKYYVAKVGDILEIKDTTWEHRFLIFKTREMAEEFLSCFKDLIEKAEMWL